MKQLSAQPCTTDRYFLGECARYDEVRQELYWVNVAPEGGQFFRARAKGTNLEIITHYDFPGSFTALAPQENRADGWIVAMDDSLLVRVLNRVADLDEKIESFLGGEIILVAVIRDTNPAHEFHYKKRSA